MCYFTDITVDILITFEILVNPRSFKPLDIFWKHANIMTVKYRQMGELWTLFEFACSLYLTCNMVLEIDGSISRVLLCIMIFSILRLYGMKFSIN